MSFFWFKINFQNKQFILFISQYYFYFFVYLCFLSFFPAFFLPSFHSIEANDEHLMYSIIIFSLSSFSLVLILFAFFFSLTSRMFFLFLCNQIVMLHDLSEVMTEPNTWTCMSYSVNIIDNDWQCFS